MALVVDANVRLICDRMGITTSRMVREYGLATVDEIIEAEAEKGNKTAVNYMREAYHSPEKLIKIFDLMDVENKFRILHKMDYKTRLKLLPKMEKEDLVMGLHFFTQEKLLKMLLEVDTEELVRVALEAFPLEQIVMMFSEEDLSEFYMNEELEKEFVLEQMKLMPLDMMRQFIEGVTGMPMEETDPIDFINSLAKLPDEEFRKFTSQIDPEVQRQLTLQIAEEDPRYLTLFNNSAYVNMLSELQKPDMIKPLIMLNQESLAKMVTELPDELMAVCMAQIDTREFAKFLQKGSNMKILEKAWIF